MDENNQPQQEQWREALMALGEVEETPPPAPAPEPPLSGDTQPLPNIADVAPSQTAELDRIMQELRAMDQPEDPQSPPAIAAEEPAKWMD